MMMMMMVIGRCKVFFFVHFKQKELFRPSTSTSRKPVQIGNLGDETPRGFDQQK